MRKTLSLGLAAAVLASLPAAAQAQRWHGPSDGYGYGYDGSSYDRGEGYGYDGYGRGVGYNGSGYNRRADRAAAYGTDRPVGYGYGDRRGWRGRTHCDRGTGGTIIGAIAGGLAGNALVGRYGDHTLGTIAGAGLGAVTGRAIDRDC